MYSALLGPVNGVTLIEAHTFGLVTEPRTDEVETLSKAALPVGGAASPTLSMRSDFGYVCSLMRDIGPHGDPRWKTLIEAVRRCI